MTLSQFYCAALGFLLPCYGGADPVNEYQLKSAFIYNLAKFVEWPPSSFSSDKAPMRICVLGKDPFEGALQAALNGKTLAGRPFAISAVSGPSAAAGCQILFISASERSRLPSIFASLPSQRILTVGETQGFAEQGGIVNLWLENGRVHMEINADAAAQAKLWISSKLLNLAQIVKGKDAK